ncbi:hypothetical protein Hdeb2414_s0012g00385881 [Helianthus debilis subsp. tardiflorus]
MMIPGLVFGDRRDGSGGSTPAATVQAFLSGGEPGVVVSDRQAERRTGGRFVYPAVLVSDRRFLLQTFEFSVDDEDNACDVQFGSSFGTPVNLRDTARLR